MSMLNLVASILGKTVGKWKFPYVDKKYDLDHYFELEKRLRELDSPFAVALTKGYGHGSNILIKIAQSFTSNKAKRNCKITHAIAHIGINNGYKHRAVEAIATGIQEVSLLKAIGQKDVVVIRVPNPKKLNSQVCKYAIEYLKNLVERDKVKNIEYDNKHDYHNDESLDCSETIYRALTYGFRMADQESSVKLINVAGKDIWSPADIRVSDLFIDLYTSEKGFIDGNV